MKYINGLLLFFAFLICFSARGQAPGDSLQVRVPDILLDSADYGFSVLGFDLIAYVGRLSLNKEGAPVLDKRIILAGRKGDVRQVIEMEKLGKKFARDWRNRVVLNLSFSGREKKLYLLMDDIGSPGPEYLLIYDMDKGRGQSIRLKLKDRRYKIMANGNSFFYDDMKKQFFIPVNERRKLEGRYAECPEYFENQHGIGVFSLKGKLIRVMVSYSPLFRSGPCLFNFRNLSFAPDADRRILGVQEKINPQLRLFNMDTGEQLSADTTHSRPLRIYTSRKEELLWPFRPSLVNPLYYGLRYDSLNLLWFRIYKPPLPDTVKNYDRDFENYIDEYLAGRIKSCPAVNPEKEERRKRYWQAPRSYQLLDREGKMLGQLTWKSAFYYASEKGAVWLARSEKWKEKGYFMIYRFPLQAFH